VTLARAKKAIEERGIILVYPIDNAAEPASLWSALHPRSRMRWSWDEGSDPRVAELWHLRERLARTKDVVYTKWFRGRATFFSRPVFRGMLAALRDTGNLHASLGPESREILERLEETSPLSTKELRQLTGLTGKPLESTYARALRDLWLRLLIVGAGEVPDGAFPSLAVGATRLLFEDLWEEREPADAKALASALASAPLFAKQHVRVLGQLTKLAQGGPISARRSEPYADHEPELVSRGRSA
jgi:hypothetical protein